MKPAWGILIVGVLVLGAGPVCAKDAPKGPQTVTNYGKKPAAQFDHGKHADIQCVQCHHNEKDGNYKCGSCHKLEGGDAPEIKDAFHGKDQGTCYECHVMKDAKNKMKCAECHKE